MFTRRKPNKSGTFSVQVLMKQGRNNVVIRSFGASKDEDELRRMEMEASRFISTYGGQMEMDFSAKTAEEEIAMLVSGIADIRQDAVKLIVDPVYDGIGFGRIQDPILRSLVISRLCQPLSKLATSDYLRRYFREDVHYKKIYRYMDKLYDTQRELVQQISVEHTMSILDGCIGLVFYDVTTLYFETAKEDVLRSPGFSKDGKTAESQVVLGLLVSEGGYPLSYSLFNGKQFEGRTMIPIIDDFVQRFGLTDFIVVADAGLLSRKNIALLKAAGYKFILGGRIKKETEAVQDWVLSLPKDIHQLHEKKINGDERVIVGYSDSRAAKDRHNREKGIQRLRKAYSSGKIKKANINQRGYNKFLVIENDVMVGIDEDKIAKDAQWDGLKSYVTNTDLPAGEVIAQYHGLWVVERAFRISKNTIEARPMFHFTERRIEAHVCICFITLKVYKELERILHMLKIDLSVDRMIDIAKTISTVTFRLSDGKTVSRTMLTTPEQELLAPLLPKNSIGCPVV